MSERLGEMLLHNGALTEAQLEEVLSAQSIYGGRIGTNLLEMGLVSEEDLGRMLNEKLGVPCVEAASLEAVAPALVALIPLEMARNYRVLPIALEGRRLTVAMADPSDFRAIDEIGFATGLVVVPRVCPELRLSLALEHYYGLKRTVRYIPVEGGARTTVARMGKASVGGEALRGDEVDRIASGDAAIPGPRDPAAGHPGSTGNRVDAATLRPGRTAGTPCSGATAGSRGLEDVMEALAGRFVSATCEAEVVNVLMSYLGEEFDRAGFLSLQRDTARGVQAVAEGGNVDQFGGWLVGLEDAALLKQVLREKEPYIGLLPAAGTEESILLKIGGRPGSSVLLLPLLIEGVAVAFLLVVDDKGRLAPGLFDLRRVVAKSELAFEMLGIRKRICIV